MIECYEAIPKSILDKPYIKYALDVIEGRIPACEAIVLACRRMIRWFACLNYYFDYEEVDKKIRLISKLKHWTGIHNGKPFILLPWQQWVFANVYGWKDRETNHRVIQNVFIMVSRKNGKTALASGMGIIGEMEENGAEVDLVANSRQQATIAFDMCRNFTESVDPKKTYFKRFRDTIKLPRKKSVIQVLCSDAMSLDGWNPSTFIIDEMHAQKDWSLYNVMKSGQGSRENPLAIVITTAGFLVGNDYPCYSMRTTCMEILRGLKEDDSQFAAIYELDENDDFEDESCWVKCCPSLGQTVKTKYLRDQVKAAKNNSALLTGVLTKNFNRFCKSQDIWLSDDDIQKVTGKVSWDDFDGNMSFMGTDLSSVSDLTASAIMMPPDPSRKKWPDKFVFKVDMYIPYDTMENSSNRELYKQWKRSGYVKQTSGNVVDYDYILADQKKLMKSAYLYKLAYDDWNATQWAINATNEGLPLEPYSQSIGSFNKPTKFFEMLVKSGRVIIDDNPCVRWCIQNCELKYDHNENCKPIKAQNDKNKKIDPVIAMLEALGVYLDSPQFTPEVFAM